MIANMCSKYLFCLSWQRSGRGCLLQFTGRFRVQSFTVVPPFFFLFQRADESGQLKVGWACSFSLVQSNTFADTTLQ